MRASSSRSGAAAAVPPRLSRTRTLQVDGHPPSVAGMHAALVGAANAHLDDVHRSKCTPETPLLFARMDCHGVGEDLNQAVRMFAVAVSQRRQLVFLPPAPEDARNPKSCALPETVQLSASEPWHWLVGQKIPMGAILHPSSCQLDLLARMPDVMEALARSPAGNVTRVAFAHSKALAERSRESQSLWRSHLAVSRHVPRLFQRQGLLWWFQMLTTYLVRVRDPLAARLSEHPAMKPFLANGGAETTATTAGGKGNGAARYATLDDVRWLGWGIRCGKRFCDGVGPGWLPPVRFDAAAHIRLGDACRQRGLSRHYYTHVRRCDLNLSVVVRKIREAGLSNGTLFVASDSQQIIDEVASGGAHPFRASYLEINRSRFETSAPTEKIAEAANRLNALLEALMDMLLLSRGSVIAGKMMSNFPRVAIQMRVQLPRRSRAGAYVSLDDRPWCSRTSCREGWLPPNEQLAATKRELARNPLVYSGGGRAVL